ncbi:ATP-binding cassette domain-containing protein, partial [candidate division KSB1 bacterium]|nr:ATP-binding cassette domain-containing protein [candidate division KSB1 bacterium]
MIKVKNIKKSFEESLVLKGVNLQIEDSETLVILGPSGQGKTVFIKTLVRLIQPDSGSIYYDDLNVLKMPKKEWLKFQNNLAFVFQNSALFDFLDVRENLNLFLRMHKDMS